jgi:hypothetical protein
MEQLTANGNDVVTMCPICLFNLAGAANGQGTKVEDISEYLVRAYGVEKESASWEPK